MIKNIIAIIDDSPVELSIFGNYVKRMGNEALKVSKPQDIVDCFLQDKKIDGHSYRDIDVILLNLYMRDINGIEILEKIQDKIGNTQIIMITASTDKNLAIRTIALGVYDFIVKGEKDIYNKLSVSIANALKKKHLKYKISNTNLRSGSSLNISDIISRSEIMKEVISSVKKAINSMVPLFISGEEGSGKELIAKIIHDSSIRFKYPFTTLNCKNIAPDNLDKILFGYHAKDRDGKTKKINGKIKIANQGTLYIENIEFLPYEVQTKLANFIQCGEVELHNSIDLYSSDTRIIASSVMNIDDLMENSSYNLDLFERLNILPINVPNLQQRGKADIELIANSFCNTFSINENKIISGISEEAMNMISNYKWQRNIKQLRNAILKAVILCDDKYLLPKHFPTLLGSKKQNDSINDKNLINLFKTDGSHKTLREIQQEIVSRLSKDFKYDKNKIIETLNIKKNTN